ncbi:ribosomal-protein-alanine acetyltransferase [Candidatus Rubidus massiliensis]|nr:ribosomal-protein-alanine acetyltransferase [Candidatus Rubidus massiliensis]
MLSRLLNKNFIIHLRDVCEENEKKIEELSVFDDQKQFVTSNKKSIAEAKMETDQTWFKAIYANDTPVGFVMLKINLTKDYIFLCRFMIDKHYQNMGIGKKALELVINYLKNSNLSSSSCLIKVIVQGQKTPVVFIKNVDLKMFKPMRIGENWIKRLKSLEKKD